MAYLFPSDQYIANSEESYGGDSPIARYRRIISELGDGKRRHDEERWEGPVREVIMMDPVKGVKSLPVQKQGGRLDPPLTDPSRYRK